MVDITGAAGSTAADVSMAETTTQVPNQQFDTDMFLQLLVTQLRYQDPMSEAQDTGEMITQLSMFTLLEQVIQLQDTVEKHAASQDKQQSLNLLNQQVEVRGHDGSPINGTVSAVDFSSTGPILTIGDQEYPLNSVTRVEGGSTEDGQ
ncbi:MAG: flagellar hook assembly protein FlgD [Bacillota bacterium]